MPLSAAWPPYRLVRNPATRAVFERLADAGVTGSVFTRFEADSRAVSAAAGKTSNGPHGPNGLSELRLAVEPAAGVEMPPSAPTAPGDDDRVVVAREGEEVVGWQYLGTGPVAVPSLGTTVDPPGVYFWGLYVANSHRRRGLATALVERALAAVGDGAHRSPGGTGGASEAGGPTNRVTALVAIDNGPSERVLRANGFAATRRHGYLRVGPLDVRRSWSPGDARVDAERSVSSERRQGTDPATVCPVDPGPESGCDRSDGGGDR